MVTADRVELDPSMVVIDAVQHAIWIVIDAPGVEKT